MEVLKTIIGLPKWMILLIPRFLIAILNVFPCCWCRVCVEKTFLSYSSAIYSRYDSTSYLVKSKKPLRLGHWFVALLRGF